MFDFRPVALEVMVRGITNVHRARISTRGSLRASQTRSVCTSCLMLSKQAGVWLNSRYPTCTTPDLTTQSR